ncbi:SRPBCC domain-containing protein [Gulosibacter massiliensis]|uniref:SRPBCC domain-containing protein n=1 Tax=Gulosibacter massiliensis TaxID=2479839 RepID=UPI000F62EB75|nr:SRPBCC domain-containing protein [Gulosibacter massiliensis]
MAPNPTGKLVASDTGHDLVLTRLLSASLAEAWAEITDPERTAKWFGAWEGEAEVGATIRVQLGFEEGSEWAEMRILECERPRRVRLLSVGEDGGWDVALELEPEDVTTELRFIMCGVELEQLGEIGPGWEYYLDQLVASKTGAALPDFNDYYPAQREYYADLASEAGQCARE